jgi:prepilin-type N-terminal cleavage/methylation domain-containing protein
MRNRKIKGFTLVELLVVIAIIGLLASIVLVSLNTARSKARDSRRLSDWHQVALALELYYDNNNNAYPIVIGCTAANWSGTMSTAIEGGGYMTEVPLDPLNNATYFYAYSSPTPGPDYVIRGRLEQNATPGAPDVEGDILSCTTANSASCNDPAYCVMP